MIPTTAKRLETACWQQELAQAITDPTELLRLLDLEPAQLAFAESPPHGFPLRVTRFFADLMRPGDVNDPLLRQVLPVIEESRQAAGFVTDPVGDLDATQSDGLLQKYRGRALMVTTGSCAIHCRYCFRRHYPYGSQSVLRNWRTALDALRTMPDCTELILSGGDPLTLSDSRLGDLLDEAAAIPSLKRLRIHTRLPVVLPNRVTDRLAIMLSRNRLQCVCVIHVNHPQEISPALGAAMQRLSAHRVTLLNQSVLLKSVNDDADVLCKLSELLFDIGVLPYYLHLLDPVSGAAHFEVALGAANALIDDIRSRLPGYLVPKVVREIPGAAGKTALEALSNGWEQML